MAEERPLPREVPPPASDEWRRQRAAQEKRKSLGLKLFHRSHCLWAGCEPDGLYGYVQWYRDERARDNAIHAANGQRYVVAMMKVER